MGNLLLLGEMAKADFCTSTGNIWQFVGYFLFWFKIIIPLIIIILGVIDLGKAVVSSKDDEVKKASTGLLKRVVIGIVIFFIPTIVYMLFGLVNVTHDNSTGADVCYKCLLQPFKYKDKCKGSNFVDINEG